MIDKELLRELDSPVLLRQRLLQLGPLERRQLLEAIQAHHAAARDVACLNCGKKIVLEYIKRGRDRRFCSIRCSAVHRGANQRAQHNICRNGHEYTPENTYIVPNSGYRQCRACAQEDRRKPGRKAKARARRVVYEAERVTRPPYVNRNRVYSTKRDCRACGQAFSIAGLGQGFSNTRYCENCRAEMSSKRYRKPVRSDRVCRRCSQVFHTGVRGTRYCEQCRATTTYFSRFKELSRNSQ